MKLSWNKRFSGERGSITVTIAFLLPIMVLMIALIVNINHLIFTKIRLQNTVDACALSAAAVQAAGLNEIADLNIEMTREYKRISGILRSGTWYNYNHARNARDFFYNGASGVIDWIYRYQKQFNNYYASQAEIVAQQVKDLNFSESMLTPNHNTGRLTEFIKHKKSAAFAFYTASFSLGSPVPTLRWYHPDDPRYAGSHDGRYWMPAKRKVRVKGSFKIPERIEKIAPTYVYYQLTLPAKNYILASSIFGSVPVLKARAAAKPAGGHVYDLRPNYEAVLIK